MEIVAACPLSVAELRFRSGGAWMLTVVCKATYLLAPGESKLAPAQDAPIEADEHWNNDATRSLRVASDLAPFKPRADVILVGSAFAPERRPSRSLVARLCVGELDKSIAVFADRAWTREGALREGEAFVQMPLTWERAAGGPGTMNPAGIRTGIDALPNLQPPGLSLTRPGEAIAPVGFAPIAPGWPTRKLQGAAAFNAAPIDQQLPALRGDEAILLVHLHPEHARLSTRLSRVTPRAMAERGDASEEIALTCDTLTIDADRGVCSLTWRGQMALRHPEEEGRVVVTAALPSPSSARVPAWAVGAVDPKATQLGASPRGPALPFREGQTPPVVDMKSTMPLGFDLAPPAPDMKTTLPASPVIPAPALPFLKPEAPRFGPPPEAPRFGPPPEPVAPPPLIGPLAKVEMPEAPAEIAPAPTAPALPIDAFPIERCAAIAASIARRRAEEAQILEDNQLDPSLWAQLDRHYTGAIREEAARGKTGLLEAYDAAYLAQLERERGPIAVEDYARLVVAAERGAAAALVTEMSLPRGALLRLERVWLRRIVADDELSGRVNAAVAAAREA